MNRKYQIIFALIVFSALIIIMFTPAGTFIKDKVEDKEHVTSIESDLLDSDYDINLIGYNGAKNTNLLDLKKSGKVVFINFWGSWCPPCVLEMPSIQKLYESKKQSVEFVLISIQDSPEKINSFLHKNKFTMPVYEPSSPISNNIMPRNFPTTYILNKKGEIVLKEFGERDWNSKGVNDLLEKLINE